MPGRLAGKVCVVTGTGGSMGRRGRTGDDTLARIGSARPGHLTAIMLAERICHRVCAARP
jgi:hypothetical protein